LIEAIVQIPEEKFGWAPCPSASSAEAILRHVAEFETWYVSMIVHRDGRYTDRSLRAISGRVPLLQKLEEIRTRTLQAIQQLKPVDLEAVFQYRGREHTVRQILLRLLRHEHYHTGQINYISFLLHPEASGQTLPPPP
jgi:uncharacterized damage-inducible protein DinB